MSATLLRFLDDGGRARFGRLRQGEVLPLPGDWPSTEALLTEGRGAIEHPGGGGAALPLAAVLDEGRLLSPITKDQQVICQAVNYRAHSIEAGFGPDGLGSNVFFRKASSSLAPARGVIRCPADVRLLDYELELGLVVGRRIDGPLQATWDDLDDRLAGHIAGVVMINDVSARDQQVRDGQFYRSKSHRGFGPTGPYLRLLDRGEARRLRELRLTLTVDGQPRQSGLAADMIYEPPATLSELSAVMDLRPGDLIATGTPAGVALRVPRAPLPQLAQLLPARLRFDLFLRGQLRSDRYLRPGAVIEATIATDDGAIDLGRQRSVIA